MDGVIDPAVTSSDVRRSKARSSLLSKVNDRSLKGPVRWNKAVNEVQINNYKTECRKLGAPTLFTRQHFLPSALSRRLDQNSPSSFMATYSYHLNNENRKQEATEMFNNLGLGLEKEMTLTEIHHILNHTQSANHHPQQTADQSGDSTQNGHLPKLSINIQRTQNGYSEQPDVKLTLKRISPLRDRVASASPNANALYSQIKSKTYGPDMFQQWENTRGSSHRFLRNSASRESFGVSSDRSRINPKPFQAFQISDYGLDSARERTKQWIDSSPLGPEPPPYDISEIDTNANTAKPESTTESKPSTTKQRPKTVNINDSIIRLSTLENHTTKDSDSPRSPLIKPFSATSQRPGIFRERNKASGKRVRFGSGKWLYPNDQYMQL